MGGVRVLVVKLMVSLHRSVWGEGSTRNDPAPGLRPPARPQLSLVSEAMLAELRPRLVDCRRYTLEPSWRLQDRVIPRPVLWYVTAGGARCVVDGQSLDLAPTEALMLRPGTVLSARPSPTGPPVLISVNFHARVLGDQELIVLANLPPKPSLPDTDQLGRLVERLCSAAAERSPTFPLVALACLAEILALLLQTFVPPGDRVAPNRHILAAIQYIHSHLTEPPTVDAVAGAVGVSPSHLRNLFHAHFGLSPLAYVQSARFAAACNLLADPAHRVADVAYTLGFKDANYFTRWFARRVGAAPSIYRQRFVL